MVNCQTLSSVSGFYQLLHRKENQCWLIDWLETYFQCWTFFFFFCN